MQEVVVFVLAIAPILWLIIALSGLKMPGYKACPIALLLSVFLAGFVRKMKLLNLLTAGLEGAAMAIWPICLVIVAAIFTYNICVHSKSMETIKQMLTDVSNDKRILVMIIAWCFGGFMEGMAGFGTAVAIPASMLIGLGYDPIFAALACLIADTTPTTFGSIGIPVVTISKVTNLDVTKLSYFAGLQLLPLVILTPFLLVILTGKSIKALKGVWHITLCSGLAFIIPELLAARFLGAELPVILGSICSLLVTVFLGKYAKNEIPEEFQLVKSKDEVKSEIEQIKTTKEQTKSTKEHMESTSEQNIKQTGDLKKEGIKAWSPFLLIFMFLVLTSKAVLPLHDALSTVQTSIRIYQGKNAMPTTFSWVLTPGILILIAACIGARIQKVSAKDTVRIFFESIKQMAKTILTIISIMATAKIMSYSGMIDDIATVFVLLTGNFYPLVAPFIASIGSFVTGSATPSSVLFGGLQQQTAKTLEMNELWLTASNTVGACAGKIISPQSIAIAVAAIGKPGSESYIMKKAVKFYILFIILMGLICYFGLKLLGA
jgi:lactate permease